MMLYKDNDNAANSMGNLQTHGQTYHCVALCVCVCVCVFVCLNCPQSL